MAETNVFYEVRLPGDGEFEYFSEPAESPYDGEQNYNDQDLDSAKAYAANIEGAYVVKVTEEVV